MEREGQNSVLLPASNTTGFLSQVGETVGSATLSVSTVDVEGRGPMAFAAYHAPLDFATSPTGIEAALADRKIFIKVKLTALTGEAAETTQPLRILRPPVILVHGLWGSPASWNMFEPLISDSRFFVDRIDYFETNAAALNANAVPVLKQLRDLIKNFKIKKQVAIVQADVITHSMGGNLSRMLPLLGAPFFRDDNLGRGDVHKLINIAPPHFGSGLARFLRQSPCVSRIFTNNGMRTNQGAIEDLLPDSPALNQLNATSSTLLQHQVLGLAAEVDKFNSEDSLGFRILRLRCSRDFRGTRLLGFYDSVLKTHDHDLVVAASSQAGGARTNVTIFRDVIHVAVPNFFIGIGELESENISRRVIQLLNTGVNAPDF